MYTQCPSCQTYFHLTPEQLRAAGGQVRCGVCDTTFNALETIQEALPQQPPGDDAPAGGSATAKHRDTAAAAASDKGRTKQQARDKRQAERASKKAARSERKAQKAASEDPGIAAILGWFAANLFLIALFPLQFFYFERDMLASEYPGLRPHLEQACAVVGCEVIPRRDLDAIEISRRDVRAHPEVEGALLIHAQLVNRAAFAQPYPSLELTLSDLQDQPMAQRRFLPKEYLGDAQDPDGLMGPGDSATITLAVHDPGDEAINFRFHLE